MAQDRPTWAAAPPHGAEDGDASAGRFRWSPWATVWWTAVIALVTVVSVGFIAGFIAGFQTATDPSPDTFAATLARVAKDHLAGLSAAQALISGLLVLLLTRRRGDLGRVEMLAQGPIGPRRLGIAVAAIFIGLFLLTEVPQWIFGISDRAALKWITQLSPLWLAILLMVAIAPVSEELLFRGFIYGGLARSGLGPIGAVLVTSAVWAVVHLQYAWPVVGQVFVYGLVLGVARWRTGSLWPSMVAHVLINLYAAIAAYSTFGVPA